MRTPLWKEHETPYPTSALPAGEHLDAVVVGAGLTGLVAGLMLAETGGRVAVLESRTVGAGASGATTAKASLLQSNRLSQIAKTHNADLAGEYLRANEYGLEWLDEFCDAHRVPVEHPSAFTFAAAESGVGTVEDEHRLAQELGLPTRLHDALDVPFPTYAAVELPNQLQMDPTDLLRALTAALTAAGGIVVDHCRVTGLQPTKARDRISIETSAGQLSADQVVLATATPILEKGPLSSKLTPQRSYLCSFDFDGTMPEGMLISVETPSRSLRTAVVGGRRRLLVGGNGHRTGQSRSTRAQLQDIEHWTGVHFPGARTTHAWSAQDFHPVGMVPMVTTLGWGADRIHFAGGYSKWGLAAAPAAARQVADRVLGRPESVTFGDPSLLGTAKNAVKSNIDAPGPIVGNLLRAGSGSLDAKSGPEGESKPGPAADSVSDEGVTAVPEGPAAADASATVMEGGTAETGRDGATPAGEAIVDGRVCRVSLVCPHLGGILAWNDSEESWDCPLHGSRFDADGTLLEGPATSDLTRL
ncbi:FAD-dependent oxidoreductase [Brevibacterium daeguense]|uniref:FAD-dependent oxidoreductase n=1 Tax=Brevibacterium daeguense TaxID=909936 RepID=A0ABP8EKF0_9MICO|nr:FAD-dependent oxidoreductase [Brevibacterium daeguense]